MWTVLVIKYVDKRIFAICHGAVLTCLYNMCAALYVSLQIISYFFKNYEVISHELFYRNKRIIIMTAFWTYKQS